jgi:hypothetical protein
MSATTDKTHRKFAQTIWYLAFYRLLSEVVQMGCTILVVARFTQTSKKEINDQVLGWERTIRSSPDKI